MECKKCGQILGEKDTVCPKCGTNVDSPVNSINDLFSAEEPKEQKPKKKSGLMSNKFFVLAGAIAVIAFIAVLLMVGDAGKLRRAGIFAYFKNYEMASKIADTCKEEDTRAYKDYYIYLSYADRLLEEDNLSRYEDIINTMVSYDNKIDYGSLTAGDREKYSMISKAINLRDGYDMDLFEQQLLIPKLLEEQIKEFKEGKTFDIAPMKKKVNEWKDGFDSANRLYGNVMSTELPSYGNVLQELEKMISNLSDPEYNNQSNIYFTKYNSNYKNPYTSQNIETLIENVKRQADYNCSKSICWALYHTERGVKIPQISEYKKVGEQDVEGVQVTALPTLEPQIEGYYSGFDNVPDFGYYLGLEPISSKDFDYYYSYADNEDVDVYAILSQYEQAMYKESFRMDNKYDSNGVTTYEYTNDKYGVSVVHYTESKHVDIHIKNVR